MKILLLPIVLLLLYLLALRGRCHHPGLSALRGWSYAHRGLHDESIPENSLEAFRAAAEAGYGIELDIHLMQDGGLAILHDSLLNRMTGQDGRIEEKALCDLPELHLNGTEAAIPTLSQVLEEVRGRVPLILELKSFGGNHAALCQAVCTALGGYNGIYCLESFDPRCVLWLKHHRPELIRGQLYENFLKLPNIPQPWLLRLLATWQLETFLTKPDFIACRYSQRRSLSNFLCRRLWHLQGIAWTLRTEAEYAQAQKEGWIPIFENIRPQP